MVDTITNRDRVRPYSDHRGICRLRRSNGLCKQGPVHIQVERERIERYGYAYEYALVERNCIVLRLGEILERTGYPGFCRSFAL